MNSGRETLVYVPSFSSVVERHRLTKEVQSKSFLEKKHLLTSRRQ